MSQHQALIVPLHPGAGAPAARPAAPRRRWLRLAAAAAALVCVGAAALYLYNGPQVYRAAAAPLAVTLTDGSEVILNAGSELTVDRSFSAADRRVNLSGEAFFDIARDEAHPFTITVGEAMVEVLGTSFNIRADRVNQAVNVEVSTGRVRVMDRQRSTVQDIRAGQNACLTADRTIIVTESPHLNRHAWRTSRLVFERTPLSEALPLIGNAYGVSIDTDNVSGLSDCESVITAVFDGTDLREVLDNVIPLSNLSYTLSDDQSTVLLSGQCR